MCICPAPETKTPRDGNGLMMFRPRMMKKKRAVGMLKAHYATGTYRAGSCRRKRPRIWGEISPEESFRREGISFFLSCARASELSFRVFARQTNSFVAAEGSGKKGLCSAAANNSPSLYFRRDQPGDPERRIFEQRKVRRWSLVFLGPERRRRLRTPGLARRT